MKIVYPILSFLCVLNKKSWVASDKDMMIDIVK